MTFKYNPAFRVNEHKDRCEIPAHLISQIMKCQAILLYAAYKVRITCTCQIHVKFMSKFLKRCENNENNNKAVKWLCTPEVLAKSSVKEIISRCFGISEC